MASHTPKSVLESFYAAERAFMSAPPEERDPSAMSATIADNFLLYQTSALPYAGTYVGPAGMAEWGAQMASYFSVVDVQDVEVFERPGSDRVVVLSNVRCEVRKTGEKMVFPFAQEVRVDVEKGQMTEMRPFYRDVAEVNRALGFTPKN